MESLAGAAVLTLALAAVGGYLLGSIPFGFIAARAAGIDIRTVGSGNIGATNVLRTGRKDLAALTLIGDSGKGALAVGLAYAWAVSQGNDPESHVTRVHMALAAAGAFTGHLFPVWLKFKGGKGVATFFGTMLALAPFAALLAGITWLAMAFLFRISSLAALTAVALAPFFVLATEGGHPAMVAAVFMAVLVYVRHAANIRRLLKGEEPRIGAKKAPAPE